MGIGGGKGFLKRVLLFHDLDEADTATPRIEVLTQQKRSAVVSQNRRQCGPVVTWAPKICCAQATHALAKNGSKCSASCNTTTSEPDTREGTREGGIFALPSHVPYTAQ